MIGRVMGESAHSLLNPWPLAKLSSYRHKPFQTRSGPHSGKIRLFNLEGKVDQSQGPLS